MHIMYCYEILLTLWTFWCCLRLSFPHQGIALCTLSPNTSHTHIHTHVVSLSASLLASPPHVKEQSHPVALSQHKTIKSHIGWLTAQEEDVGLSQLWSFKTKHGRFAKSVNSVNETARPTRANKLLLHTLRLSANTLDTKHIIAPSITSASWQAMTSTLGWSSWVSEIADWPPWERLVVQASSFGPHSVIFNSNVFPTLKARIFPIKVWVSGSF